MSGFFQDYTTVRLPSGTTYRYVHVRPKHRDNHYILFLHGYPSTAYDWRHQINYFCNKGYGIIAPDPLGYGGTDKPAEVEAYRAKKMAGEMRIDAGHWLPLEARDEVNQNLEEFFLES